MKPGELLFVRIQSMDYLVKSFKFLAYFTADLKPAPDAVILAQFYTAHI